MTVAAAALIAGCGGKSDAPKTGAAAVPATAATAGTAAAQAQPAAAAPATASAQTPTGAPAGKLAGPIVETMDSGGYTYMKIKTAQGEEWVATPMVKVKKGQVVSIAPQMTAEKFQSSSLNRTFDRIVFGTLETPNAPGSMASSAPGGMPPAGMPGAMGTPADHMKPRVEIGDVNVPKAEGADAKTVSEVWAGRASLSDKEVVVRGKVVKFLGHIMGTNFLHLRDGSGSEASGDHDLTVTTNETAAVGEVVTVRGIVHVDKDFGAGYRYPVIVEKASIKK